MVIRIYFDIIDESEWYQYRSLFKDRLCIVQDIDLQQIFEERKRRVIHLYFNQHKTYAEITEIERISPCDIHAIIKEEKSRRQKYKQQELSSKAYKLFSEGKRLVQVAITLNIGQPEITKLYREYWKLKRLNKLNSTYKETDGKLGPF